MRCMHLNAECLYAMGKVRESVALLEELVDLNPNDNQGVRDTLTLYLIRLNEGKKFIKYAKIFAWDDMAFALFNRELFAFKHEGETEHSNAQLPAALKQNKFVAKLLLSDKPIRSLAGYHGRGDKNEAEYYVSYARPVWGVLQEQETGFRNIPKSRRNDNSINLVES